MWEQVLNSGQDPESYSEIPGVQIPVMYTVLVTLAYTMFADSYTVSINLCIVQLSIRCA